MSAAAGVADIDACKMTYRCELAISSSANRPEKKSVLPPGLLVDARCALILARRFGITHCYVVCVFFIC